MENRFIDLFNLSDKLYAKYSPVIISKGVLLKDTHSGNIVAQLKFQNMCPQEICALIIDIEAYNILGDSIEQVVGYQYLDLNILPGQEFGSNKAILFSDKSIKSFEIIGLSAVLSDGSILKVKTPMAPLPTNLTLEQNFSSSALCTQYKREISPNAVYVPQEAEGIWMCACGTWNFGCSCTKCNASKEKVFKYCNVSLLSHCLEEYEKNESEKKQFLATQAEIAQIKKEKQRKHLFKSIFISCFILSILLLFTLSITQWLYPKMIKPQLNYSNGLDALNAKEYVTAINIFEQLGTFKDSPAMLKEANYQLANEFFRNGELENAIQIFDNLGSYSESQTLKSKVQFEYASRLLKIKEYSKAKEIFQSLDNYESASEKVIECDYLCGKDYLEKKDYETALSYFQKIREYKDTKELIDTAQYDLATTKMSEKKYQEAIQLFETLGDYKNSIDDLNECKYLLAKQFTSNRDYDQAKIWFDKIKDYKDSNEYLNLIPQTKTLFYERDGGFSFFYMFVNYDIDVENCKIKISAKEARSSDLVIYKDQKRKYNAECTWYYEEWKRENGHILMTFVGQDPSKDGTAYRDWIVSKDLKTIRCQSYFPNGKPLDAPYLWKLVTDESAPQNHFN